MTPKNGTMILSISHMSDLVEKELETGEVIIKQDISGTKDYVPSTGPANFRALRFRDRTRIHEADV